VGVGVVQSARADAGDRRAVVPYVTEWSEEQAPPFVVLERRGVGIAYADESLVDRDKHGVLWSRMSYRPGVGRPLFGRVHPLRQRRAMRRLLCQVCAGPADQNGEGVLWLMRDFREAWPGWPNGMGETEPPVCRACARLSLRLCPSMRKGAVLVRARQYPVAGVHGLLYSGGRRPVPVGPLTVSLDDPAVRWVRAARLVRQLDDCTLVDIEDL
jgi:hypothetical protein